MDDVTRRSLLHGAGVAMAAAGLIQEAQARTEAFGPTDPYDLVIRGGEVVDPSQNLRGKRDIGIRNAAIAAVEPEIPPARGTQTLDASGQPLEQVVTLATSAPAQAINRVPKLGTLQVGAPADQSMVEIVEGPIDFVDTRRNTRKGQRRIKPMQTVKAGRPFGRPYPTPFGWP